MTASRSQPSNEQEEFCHLSNIMLLIERGLDEAMATRVAEGFREKCARVAELEAELASCRACRATVSCVSREDGS